MRLKGGSILWIRSQKNEATHAKAGARRVKLESVLVGARERVKCYVPALLRAGTTWGLDLCAVQL